MSSEVTIKGEKYALGNLTAHQQFHVTRRLMKGSPVGLGGVLASQSDEMSEAAKKKDTGIQSFMLITLMTAMGAMSDEDSDYIKATCLSVVTRAVPGGRGYAAIMAGNGALMFADITLATMMELIQEVLRGNLGPFFDELLPASFVRRSKDEK